jgi:hypothetical protein
VSRWTLSGLAPGRYQLRVWWPNDKDVKRETRPSRKRVVVVAGQATVVNVVLKDGAKSGLIAAVAVAVVVAAVRLSNWSPLGDHMFTGMRW